MHEECRYCDSRIKVTCEDVVRCLCGAEWEDARMSVSDDESTDLFIISSN